MSLLLRRSAYATGGLIDLNGTILSEVGNTPMVRLDGVYAKLECVNPTGSIKDRMVKHILDESERLGLLRKGTTVVEATSGNTGISLSYFGRQKGYDVTIIMPEDMTEERKRIIRGFGARLILCSSEGSFLEAVRIRDRMVREEHCFTTDQFSNQLNTECHFRTTGQEVIGQLKAEQAAADALVAGVGTGGTLMGIAKALKETNANLHVAAVEPTESPVMTGGPPGHHGIEGIGDGFVPQIVKDQKGNLSPEIHEVIHVRTQDAMKASMYIAENFGYCVGVSSGANFLAARELSHKFKTVVTVFPDGFTRYVSVGLRPSHTCPFHGEACRLHREASARASSP
jgi:cysteine synthase A